MSAVEVKKLEERAAELVKRYKEYCIIPMIELFYGEDDGGNKTRARAQRFPDAWKALAIDVVYHRAMLEFLKRLHREGKPIKRECLRRIKAFVSKYSEDVAAKPTLYLRNMIVGVKAWSVYVLDYATELIVDVYDTYGRHIERFRLPIEG